MLSAGAIFEKDKASPCPQEYHIVVSKTDIHTNYIFACM